MQIDVDSIYMTLAVFGVGLIIITAIANLFEIEFFETEHPYLYKISIAIFAGLGLGGLKWGLTGAILIGSVFGSLMGVIIYIMIRLNKERKDDLNEVIGNIGTVSISADKNQIGKIMISISNSMREVETISSEKLKLNQSVIVTGVSGEKLIVKPINGEVKYSN